MSTPLHERLHEEALAIYGHHPGHDISDRAFLECCEEVIERHGLRLVRYGGGDIECLGTTDGPQWAIYMAPDGSLVNLWIEGNSLGFDDQVDP